MRWFFLLSLLLAPVSALAEPVPWEVKSSTAAAAGEETPGRIELRVFQKEDHVIVRAGFSYLTRSDFYTNPGVSLDVSWYPFEWLGIDFLSGTAYFASLTDTAAALRTTTGLLPDSQKPLARVGAGGRVAFAYGKFLVEALDTVVHVDASVSLHLGAFITDAAVNFGGDVGLSVQVVAWERLLVWAEGSFVMSYEKRSTSSVASGPQGTFGLGVLF